MKNIMIVDGAKNCAYDLFQVEDADFKELFPEIGQDIAFESDIFAQGNSNNCLRILENMWNKPVKKAKVTGIDGTIFYKLDFKKEFYPTRRDSDLDQFGRSFKSADL